MPELPEVETVVRDLRGPLLGARLAEVKAGRKKLRFPWSPPWRKTVVGRKVVSINRRGKWIIIDLEGPQLVIHLGMTGQLTVTPPDAPRKDHTHLTFRFEDGLKELRFRDVRRFGSATVFANYQALEHFFEECGLGPEPFDLESTYWRECLGSSRRNLKAILLDQSKVAGVGNIYADESLFEAGLHPTLTGKDLTAGQAERLHHAVVKVLRRAIDLRGSTIRDYVGGSGLRGGFQSEFQVYGRTGEACRRCERPITRIVVAGRSTHFCAACQKPRRR